MLFIAKMAIKVMAIGVLALAVYLGVTGVQVYLTSRQSSNQPAQAIVVMGSAEYDGRPSPDLRARLSEALFLYRSGRAPVVAVTGGKIAGDTYTEAGVSATWLAKRGVPTSALVIGGGADSYENISSVADPLKARGVSTVLMVTDPFHEDRSMAIAGTFGFDAMPSPTTTSPITGFSTIPYFAKETVAVAFGRIVGYGLLSNTAHPAAG
jgi:uncharacterized SAM-binding protein YcdF (DUF218 family)